MWPDLPLRTKGLVVIAVPAAATVLIACASYVLGTCATAAGEAVNHSLQVSQEIQRLKADEAETSAHVRAYFITGEEVFADKARDAIAAFDGTLDKLSALIKDDPEQVQHVLRIAAIQRSRVEHIFAATTRFQSGALPPEALRATLHAKETERIQMESVLRAMADTQKRLHEARSLHLDMLRLELRATTGFCLFFGVVGGVGISLLFASGITNRVRMLQQNVARLAAGGPLDPLPEGRDEIGALSADVARTAEILRQRAGALENALHGIAQVDAAGRYVSFNKAFAELASFSECSQPANLVATVVQDDREKVEAAISLMLASGRAETEARIADAFGSLVDVVMTFLPVSEDPGAGYYLFLRDVTLERETQAALVSAKDSALASNLAKTEFLAKISHDIRTPLNAILGAANLLSETSLRPDQNEYVSMFQRNCQRLVTLINDFLDFSKIEAGALRLEKAPFRVRDVVEDAVATFRESANRKGIRLEIQIALGVPEWELGDPLRVQQVLVNLLSNALKFTEKGRVDVRVLRTSSPAGEWLRFEVSDTGPGISPEDQQRVFTAFTQLAKQNPAAAGGCGLGLTICRELVERMGGEIGVASQPGTGSIFYFGLPFEVAQPADQAAEASSSPSIYKRSPGNDTVRILIAEDTDDNRLLLAHYLRAEPVEIQFAADGQEAVNTILAGQEFDLILMDIDMPGLDGYEATKFIRNWQRTHGDGLTPIVALSAHAMREAEQAALAAGCVAHMAKPVDQPTLLKAIRRYSRANGARRSECTIIAKRIEALIPSYLASKPRQIDEARACLASKNFEPIQRFGHNLKGTGRGYGFPPIEEIGREIEKAASERDVASISGQLSALHSFIMQDQPSRVR